jgi:hypothetical protein
MQFERAECELRMDDQPANQVHCWILMDLDVGWGITVTALSAS